MRIETTLALLLTLISTGAAQGTASRPTPAATAQPASQPTIVGAAAHRYEWVEEWARRPAADSGERSALGNTHGALVVDSKGRIYANTDTADAVVRFAADGTWLSSWGEEFRGGLHGMSLRREGEREFLYLAHTSRHEALKTTLDGEILWTLGFPEASGIYAEAGQFKPTSIAVAPDGRIFVADGYGKSWIHAYDAERRYQKSFGGPGKDKGQLRTPHGLLIDTRAKTPTLLVCDRENHRLQWFSLDGAVLRTLEKTVRRPCNAWPLADGHLAIAELIGRVTILDAEDKVVTRLGDTAPKELRARNGVAPKDWQPGRFFAPHAVCADAAGDLYVMDWNATGRITKLIRR